MKIRSAAMRAGPNRRSCSLSGQRVLVHGAAGAVGSMVTRLAREFGAYVIGIFQRAAVRIDEILRAQVECLLTVVGASGTDDIENQIDAANVTVAGSTEARPADDLAIDFVRVPDRTQLGGAVLRVMKAIVVSDQTTGTAEMKLVGRPQGTASSSS